MMSELNTSFASWETFKETVSAVAKAFGTFHKLDRFRDICILRNDAVPQATSG